MRASEHTHRWMGTKSFEMLIKSDLCLLFWDHRRLLIRRCFLLLLLLPRLGLQLKTVFLCPLRLEPDPRRCRRNRTGLRLRKMKRFDALGSSVLLVKAKWSGRTWRGGSTGWHPGPGTALNRSWNGRHSGSVSVRIGNSRISWLIIIVCHLFCRLKRHRFTPVCCPFCQHARALGFF